MAGTAMPHATGLPRTCRASAARKSTAERAAGIASARTAARTAVGEELIEQVSDKTEDGGPHDPGPATRSAANHRDGGKDRQTDGHSDEDVRHGGWRLRETAASLGQGQTMRHLV